MLLCIAPHLAAGVLPEWAIANLDPQQQAWIQAHPVVRVRIGEARPDHFSENGEVKGLSVEYLQIVTERTGLKFDYVTGIPWAGAIENIAQGRDADLIITIKRTPEREALLAFTEDYLFWPWVIFTRNDAPFISNMNELKGRLVAVEKAYVMHEKLAREYPGIKLRIVPTTLDALHALAVGQVDAYVGSLFTGTYLINAESLANIKVTAPTSFDNHNQAMGVRKDWAILADIISKVLLGITPAEHQTINANWLSVRFEHGLQWGDVLLWAGLGLSLFLGVVIIIAGKNRQLRNEVAQRKHAEEERARLNRELFQARKMEALGQLTGGIAHDFNNILAIMLGYAALGIETSRRAGQEKLTEYFAQVERAGQRAKELVKEMLAFSRQDRTAPVPLQLAPLVEDEVRVLRSTLPGSIEIRTELQDGLPDVAFDPANLQQILMNLSLNARDAMAGAGTLTISVKELEVEGEECAACHKRIEGAWVELAVADTGSGVAADSMEHLFEPFFTTKEIGEGSGMGLAVVHGIMTRLKGHIVVETEPGNGFCIRLLFPPLTEITDGEGATESASMRRRPSLECRSGNPGSIGSDRI